MLINCDLAVWNTPRVRERLQDVLNGCSVLDWRWQRIYENGCWRREFYGAYSYPVYDTESGKHKLYEVRAYTNGRVITSVRNFLVLRRRLI